MKVLRNIRLLSWINFFTDFVFFAPIAIIYFERVTGSYALGMSIFSIAMVSSAIFEIPTGILSDVVGRRKTTILGAINSVICVLFYAIGGSYWVLFIGAIFQGLSRAFYSGNNDALLHDTLKETGREKDYHVFLGQTSSMFQIALAIASFAGGFMANYSYALVMWASVVPQMCVLILSFYLIEPTVESEKSSNIYNHIRQSIVQFKHNIKLRYLSAASVIHFALGETLFFLQSAFIYTLWPLWAVGVAKTISHAGAATTFYFSGKIINKFKPLRVLSYGVIFNRSLNFIALLFPTIVSPILMSGASVTYGVGSVARNHLMQKEFTQAQRATMSSLNSLAGSIVFGIFSIALGHLADTISTAFALIVANVILLLPLIFYRKIFLHTQRRTEK